MPEILFFIQTQVSGEAPHAQEVSEADFTAYVNARMEAEQPLCLMHEVWADGTECYYFREDLIEELLAETDGLDTLLDLDETRVRPN